MKERLIDLHDELKKLTNKGDEIVLSSAEENIHQHLKIALRLTKAYLGEIDLKDRNLNLFEPVL